MSARIRFSALALVGLLAACEPVPYGNTYQSYDSWPDHRYSDRWDPPPRWRGDRPDRPRPPPGKPRPDRPDRPDGGWSDRPHPGHGGMRPDRDRPDRPGMGRPDRDRTDRPWMGRPGAGERPGRADAGRPGPDRAEAGRPDGGRPDAGRPDAGRPEAPARAELPDRGCPSYSDGC